MATARIVNAWEARSQELAAWAWRRLVNRTDVWGAYNPINLRDKTYKRHDNSEGTYGKSYTAPRAKKDRGRVLLTEATLVKHFIGALPEHVIGLHTTTTENTSLWGVTEVDWHGETSSDPEANWKASLAWYGHLKEVGFAPLLTDSNGNGGYHVRFLLREPAPTPQVYNFLQWLTKDFELYGLPKRPETFPKQSKITEKNPYGNWLRLPGRHHTREQWSRVWDGNKWLEDDAAVSFILALTGDDPDLMFAPRIAAYRAALPNLGEGQGRDDVGYQFAAFLVNDLALDHDIVRKWLREWDKDNNPPKGDAEIDKWITNSGQYGQRARGSGREREKTAAAAKATENGKKIGDLTIRPSRPHRTPSGKISIPLTIIKNGQAVDHTTLGNSASGRLAVVKLLKAHGGAGFPAEAAGITLGVILAEGSAGVEEDDGERKHVCEIVGEKVPSFWMLNHRTAAGAWSESRVVDVKRADFVSFVPAWLLDAASNAVDAPRHQNGAVHRQNMLAMLKAELEILWASLVSALPLAADADMVANSAMARRLGVAIQRCWHAPCTNERKILKREDGKDGDTIVAGGSLASRVRQGRDKPNAEPKRQWTRIHVPYLAWWRPCPTEDGEVTVQGKKLVELGMHYGLAAQVKVDLPGIGSHREFMKVCRLLGMVENGSRVWNQKFAVLSRVLTDDLLDDMEDYMEV